MYFVFKPKRIAVIFMCLILVVVIGGVVINSKRETSISQVEQQVQIDQTSGENNNEDLISWVDFNVTAAAMQKAIDLDVESYYADNAVRLNWIEIISYLSTIYGGDFSKYKSADIDELAEKLNEGDTVSELMADNSYYDYYLEANTAALGGLVGEYEVEVEDDEGNVSWEKKYGLKAFSPIASGYYYNHYDDFGNSRDYGFKRIHLGHDMMALTGTPIIAVESGTVEIMGWNQYGGWRIGIRSFDGKRYYYYAHMRQNRPFAEGLEEGQVVMAGDVIGYVGHTGYSTTENVNGFDTSHLHWGLQLVFDESQKESNNEIWIDVYEITKLLENNKSSTERNDETKEHTRTYDFKVEVPEDRFLPTPNDSTDENME